MPSDTISARLPAMSTLPGPEVLVLVRRLVLTALVAGVGYALFSTASQGRCPGGISADGSFVDRLGNPTEVVPSCINLTLRPNPLVYLVLALIVVWAVTAAARNAHDEAAALRVLGWAGPAVILLAILAVALTMVTFFSISLESWDGTSVPSIPAWLAVDVEITPMEGG